MAARMSAKRWVALGASAVLFAGMVYLAASLPGTRASGPRGPWDEEVLRGEGDDKVAVIDVQGELVELAGDRGVTGRPASAGSLISQLRQAEEDDAVVAVILRLNTPGGSVVASDEVYGQVRDLRRAGKPVVASMGEVAASGGYYISSAADRIVANPSTITGSIGVIMVLVNLEGSTGKLGVEPIVIKAGRLKDIGSPFRDVTQEELAIFQSLIDEAYGRFVSVVAEGRHLSEAAVRTLADGRPYSGAQAKRLDLVDALGDFDDAVDVAERLAGVDDPTVVRYTRRLSLADLVFSRWPGFSSPVEEVERSLGVTGPSLQYLYLR